MMLAGFETPTSGEIYLDGDPISSIPPNKRGIGMVFQNYALFPHMTVKENLAFPLEVRKMQKSEVDEKVLNALSMVELQDFGNRMPLQLSGGQQQRVALARSLVFEPRLVLMDEPLGALDKNLREQMQYEIKHIHEKIGITVVYVTHDQSEALTMLGPSGSGKTTVLMMLAGFETPTSGEIYLDGNPISSIPPNKRGIGMVFQNYALFPHMTVKENLEFPLEVRKMSKSVIDEKVSNALSMVELQDFGSRMPLQLSGGQQQRVALARSLVFEPRLVSVSYTHLTLPTTPYV